MTDKVHLAAIDSSTPLVLTTVALVENREPISGARIRALIDAAADAGFDGMSIAALHHDWAVADDMTSEEYFDYHGARHIDMVTLGVCMDWATTDRQEVIDKNAHVIDVAAAAGVKTVSAVMLTTDPPPLRDSAVGLGVICDLAADRGLTVSFEFVPMSGVPNIGTAARLFEATDRENLGLMLDCYQWARQRGGPDLEALRGLGGDRIFMFQLGDAAAEPPEDLYVEGSTGRLLPGGGDFDIHGLIDVLDEMQAAPILTSEVFSKRLMDLGDAENARRQYVAARAVLAERDVRHRN